MNEQVLAFVSRYGSPALFAIVAIAAIGVPLPIMLLLIVTGSLAAQGAIRTWTAISIASLAAIAGDQAGFVIGRWGSTTLVKRYQQLLGKAQKLEELEQRARRWGDAGIFFSRWLVSPLGPWINFASGAGNYPWWRFTLWDVLGESFGAVLFIELGKYFSDRVQMVSSVLGDLSWAAVAMIAAAFLGWNLLKSRHRSDRLVGK